MNYLKQVKNYLGFFSSLFPFVHYLRPFIKNSENGNIPTDFSHSTFSLNQNQCNTLQNKEWRWLIQNYIYKWSKFKNVLNASGVLSPFLPPPTSFSLVIPILIKQAVTFPIFNKTKSADPLY